MLHFSAKQRGLRRRIMLRLSQIERQRLAKEPFEWAFIDNLFEPDDAAALAASFPCDNFKALNGYDGEKSWEYVSRSLIHIGATAVSHAEGLSPAWRALATDLL